MKSLQRPNAIWQAVLLTTLFMPASVLAQQEATQENPEELPAIKVGDQAPDFELETSDNKTVKLSERFGDKGKPVVLLFSRAHW